MDTSNDRRITISVGRSRKDTNWIAQTLTISELFDRLKTPARGTEKQADYFKLTKGQQDDLKDVGGFVGGSLSGGRRKANAVTGRDVVTLDFDTIPAYGTQAVIDTVNNLACGYCIYSTRKHLETAPRLRIILPLDRTVTADEYEPIARRLAEKIGIQMADPTTFEPSRLMYWPSCSADGEYVYQARFGALITADAILESYTDWHDLTSWPQVPGSGVSYQKLAVKQGDPEAKSGVVGAFNRTYDIYRALDEILPGIYEACDNDPTRYTYLGGSTTGGTVVYDNGKFLYSHHATDPCSGRLVNAFDLVRLHKFGDADDAAAPGTPTVKLPSYQAMCDFAVQDKAVLALVAQERQAQAVADFMTVAGGPAPVADPDDDTNWQALLARKKNLDPEPTINNVVIILDHDPLLKGKFALNQFAGRGEVLGPLPWNQDGRRRLWSDTDSNGLYWYLEKTYNLTGRGNIDSALDIHASQHAFNEVQDYINGLTWDGTPRLDTLFIDYLGAEDEPYNRAVCRKSFVAAVARAMSPGCKYDNMLILCGPQGIGKSTILDKMSRGWFNDSIRTFEGKEASELLPGVWIVEVAELDAFRKSDVSRIKQFLSLRTDRYRAAYGRHMSEFPRCCVFFGTTNTSEFLQDMTGNRRFLPVDVGINPPTKDVWRDLTDPVVDQLWAEAKARWQMGEATHLTGEIEQRAQTQQELHREASSREGMIDEFLNRQIPKDWENWPLDRRRDFWAQTVHGDIELVERRDVCAAEVWCELFNGNFRDLAGGNRDSREINAIIARMSGWKRTGKQVKSLPYGKQRGFEKVVKCPATNGGNN